MTKLLASPRRRRRLAWLGTVLLAAAAVVSVGIAFSNSENKSIAPAVDNEPLRLPTPDRPEETIAPRAANAALRVAGKFLVTAVNRRDVASSWELSSASLRAGYTRRTWSKGDIPVVPYPVSSARWEVDYTYHDRMGLRVALFPKAGSNVSPAVFTIDLKQIGRGEGRHWVVDDWQPIPERAGGSAPVSAVGLPNLAVESGDRQLGAAWILVPIGVLTLFVLVLASMGIGYWYRGRQADRAYLRKRSA